MRTGWLVLGVLALAGGCREPDGPLGGVEGGVLVVASDPPGGTISVDGRTTGRLTPDTIRGIGGLRQVTVELDSGDITYRYSAEVVVRSGDEPLVLNGPLMARCASTASDCASPFHREHQLGTVRFITNAVGALFLEAGQGEGLYWPAITTNSYLSVAAPLFAGRWEGEPVSTGLYDIANLVGRPAPVAATADDAFRLTQSAWILPPRTAVGLLVARGLRVRERVLTTTALEAVFLVELSFRNISNDPLYELVDPAVADLPGITWEDAFIGFGMDPDIGQSGDDWLSYDAATATVFAYDAAFSESGFSTSQGAPALVGLRVLRAPEGAGVTLNGWIRETGGDWSSGTTSQLAGYGMLSGTASYAPDHPGTVVGHLPSTSGDVRLAAAVGPLRLAPGDSATVVLALALAPPVAGTYSSGTMVSPGNPDDADRQIQRIAANLRERLNAAAGLLELLDQ